MSPKFGQLRSTTYLEFVFNVETINNVLFFESARATRDEIVHSDDLRVEKSSKHYGGHSRETKANQRVGKDSIEFLMGRHFGGGLFEE